MLGFTKEQMTGLALADWLGNTYSGASPIGLTAILDVAKPGDKIFMVSYGSGAGSDGFIYTCTDRLPEVQGAAEHTRAARREGSDLSRVRRVRQVPRQDQEAG
jgi:hydroxymethylglutaryl-CoA synthase